MPYLKKPRNIFSKMIFIIKTFLPKSGWIYLGALEAKYDRKRTSHEAQKTPAKKKKAYQSQEADYNSKDSPMVPPKNRSTNPINGKQKKSASHRCIQV